MNTPSYPTDRASIVNRGLVNMRSQIKGIEKDIERDCNFIEEKMELLPKLITHDAKKGLEKQIAERMIRVDNLRDVLRVLAIYIELGEQEQKRLALQPSLFTEQEVNA